MTVAQALAGWALGLSRVDDDVAHAVARHLLDGLGTAVAGYRSGAVAPAVAVATAMTAPAQATVLGDGRRVPAAAAALANGALVHAEDFDDTHTGALVHPTAVVLPAVFAAGQRAGASGREVLVAAAVGYETIIRLGASVKHGFHARGFHATSVCGTPAAALAAARLGGADVPTAVNALGIAGSQAGGLLEFLHTDATTKQLHPGWAAHAGIVAADLAAAGATGPASVVEGAYGLVPSFAGSPPQGVADDLGSVWHLLATTVKPYPVCQLSHAALDAVAALSPPVDPAAIDHVEVDVPTDSVPIVCEPAARKHAPTTAYEAKFSLPWCVAARLVDGELTLRSFSGDALARGVVRDLARRVTYKPFQPDGAAADAPGRVRVHLLDGRVLDGFVPRSHGGPDQPLDDGALVDKFVANCGHPDAADVAKQVLALAEVDDVGALLDAVNRTAGGRGVR